MVGPVPVRLTGIVTSRHTAGAALAAACDSALPGAAVATTTAKDAVSATRSPRGTILLQECQHLYAYTWNELPRCKQWSCEYGFALCRTALETESPCMGSSHQAIFQKDSTFLLVARCSTCRASRFDYVSRLLAAGRRVRQRSLAVSPSHGKQALPGASSPAIPVRGTCSAETDSCPLDAAPGGQSGGRRANGRAPPVVAW